MNKDAKVLADIAERASYLITEEFEVNAKGEHGDLVTNFDYEIENFIIDEMKKVYPDYDVVSEEFNSDGKLTKNCFTIDPIDGTINFANKCPLFAIQIALIKEGITCAAVIYIPRLNEIYVADDKKAYLNGSEIHVNNLPVEKSFFEIDGKYRLPAIERMNKFSKHNRQFGCVAIPYAFVGAGRFGGVIFRNNSVWDYLPGLHIVKMAGGYVIDEDCCHIGANTKEFAEVLKREAIFKIEDKPAK